MSSIAVQFFVELTKNPQYLFGEFFATQHITLKTHSNLLYRMQQYLTKMFNQLFEKVFKRSADCQQT